MRLDNCNPDAPCCDQSSPDYYPRPRPGLGAAWSDMWRVYEDVCVLCAGLWIGSWKVPSPGSPIPDGRPENWGSIRLDGDDYLSLRSETDNTYVRNVGMGIEGRPSATSETGVLHHRMSRHGRQSSTGTSIFSWANGRSAVVPPKDDMVEEAELVDPDLKGQHERQLMTTLAILHAFHKNTTTLLLRLAHFLPPAPPVGADASNSDSTPSSVVLTPKDVLIFELGPLSSLDQRFVEWLAEEHGGGVRLVVRRGWRDLMGLVLGFG